MLAALGGEKARCVEVAQAWARHADDLSVLAIGPRGPADQIAVGWDDVLVAEQAGPAVTGLGGQRGAGRWGWPARRGRPWPGWAPGSGRCRNRTGKAQRRRNDILSLLALGYGFQVRLIGQVAAAHAGRAEAASRSAPRWSPRSPGGWPRWPRNGSGSTPTRWW